MVNTKREREHVRASRSMHAHNNEPSRILHFRVSHELTKLDANMLEPRILSYETTYTSVCWCSSEYRTHAGGMLSQCEYYEIYDPTNALFVNYLLFSRRSELKNRSLDRASPSSSAWCTWEQDSVENVLPMSARIQFKVFPFKTWRIFLPEILMMFAMMQVTLIAWWN